PRFGRAGRRSAARLQQPPPIPRSARAQSSLCLDSTCIALFARRCVILSSRRIRDSDARNEKLDRSFVACPARSEPASGAHGPALREASLRAEPTGLPCAKRACERSPRACPARSEPASGAHGFLLRIAMCSALQLDGERILPG